jgi:hypothetical protein
MTSWHPKNRDLDEQYSATWLEDFDQRTRFARDLRARESQIFADLGGDISYLEHSLLRRGLFLEVHIRRAEARMAAGETLKDDELGRVVQATNSLLGIWKALGLKRRARDVPSLHDYLRQRTNAEAAK